MKQRARELRRNSTDAENLLWRHLRDRRMAGYKFRRQEIIEPYIADFCCLEANVIIEADGGQHSEQKDYDSSRTAFLKSKGYKIMRFWNNEVLNDTESVLEEIRRALTAD